MSRTERLRSAGAHIAVALAALAMAPWHLTDPDVLMRLAIGRWIVRHGEVPRGDPFTALDSAKDWINPQWLGDVVWYVTHDALGEAGIVGLKLAITVVAWLLVYRVARRMGAGAGLCVVLCLLGLPSSARRLTERNDLHLYWLVPTFLLLARHPSPRRMFWLLPLQALWANLHGSFLMGPVVAGACCLDALRRDSPLRASAAFRCAITAALPIAMLVNPFGARVFLEPLDRLTASEFFRSNIIEWKPPGTGLLELPIHLLAIVGLASFLPRCNRREVGMLCLVLLGVWQAEASVRFAALLAVLAVPAAAANIERALGRSRAGVRTAVGASLALVAVTVFALAAARPRATHPLATPGSAAPAAEFIAREVAAGTAILADHNAGAFLLWLLPAPRLFADPRDALGAHTTERLFDVTLNPGAFELDTQRLHIDLTLARVLWPPSPLHQHLDASLSWALIYFDGSSALYARRVPANGGLIGRHGFQHLKARLEMEYLLAGGLDQIEAEVSRLAVTSPRMAEIPRAYRLLSRGGAPPPGLPDGADRAAAAEAARRLAPAIAFLPRNPALLVYLGTARARAGDFAGAHSALLEALRLPGGEEMPLVLGLGAELARREGRSADRARILAELSRIRSGRPAADAGARAPH